MSSAAAAGQWTGAERRSGELVRVYVWEWPVRLAHWCIAYSILVLSVTGFYIGAPFVIVTGPAGANFLMGWVKLIHFSAATVFALSVAIRVYWMFVGNQYSHWNKFLPVTTRRWKAMLQILRYYFFQLRQPPGFVGHNPLAGFTYLFVFLLYLVMIGTGLGMYAASADVASPFRRFAFLLPLWGGAQSARMVHHVTMWLILAFAVHHVYSSVLMSQVEARGTIESMASGYKFVPREDLHYSGYRYLGLWDAERER